GSMYVDVVSELHDEFSGNGRRWRPIGDSVSVFGFVAAAQSEYALDPPFQCLFSISAVVESLGAVQTQVDEVGGDFLGVRPGGGMGERQRYPMASQHLDHVPVERGGVAKLDRVAKPHRVIGTAEPRVRDPVVVGAG